LVLLLYLCSLLCILSMARWAKEGARRLKNLAQINCTKGLRGHSKGISGIEVIIALGILGLVAVVFLSGLSTALKASYLADERSVAESLARSEMEYVKSQEYEEGASPSYEKTDVESPVYSGYTVSVDAPPIDPDTGDPLGNPSDDMGIQEITVTVKHADKEVFILEDYKVAR